jgi:hypothetical protein
MSDMVELNLDEAKAVVGGMAYAARTAELVVVVDIISSRQEERARPQIESYRGNQEGFGGFRGQRDYQVGKVRTAKQK